MTESKHELFQAGMRHWLQEEALTWRWWIKILIFTVIVILFLVLVDKKRLLEILPFGFLISLISLILDVIGTDMVLWEYPIRLLPLEFSEIHDLVLIPMVTMLIYQYFPTWKSYVAAMILLSAIAAFGLEKFFILMNYYKPLSWNHLYSFVLYFLIGLFCKYVTDRMAVRYLKSRS